MMRAKLKRQGILIRITGIYRVPYHLRKLNEEAYTPQVISIGPFHRDNARLQTMQDLKEEYSKRFWQRVAAENRANVRTIVNEETMKQIREFYGECIWLSDDTLPMFPGVLSVLQLTFEFFKDFNVQNISHVNSDVKILHFTDLFRTFLLPQSLWPSSPRLPQRGNKKVKLLYSAAVLQDAGVKFRVGSDEYTTEALIRNIMALVQICYIRHGYVTDYFCMLDFLTNITKDMDLLCDSGIVDNYLGDNNAATSIINNLHKNILWVGLSTEYCKLCESLNAFYKDPRHIWKAIPKRDYFSTPWRTAITVAVAILFVLTFIQTVCSILQVLQAQKLL
ncbi:hypothetical protein ACB092_04G041200 [Castanea dentata]